ncbi:hypothetical protein TNCV_2216551 [Trichonephila clavipes]|nr:hypothetical protein TNCV_2216551 [Trichonephila clavipes]
MSAKVVSRLWNRFQTSGTAPGGLATAPQLARELAAVSRRRNLRETINSRLAETVLYARRSLWYSPLTASSIKDRIL